MDRAEEYLFFLKKDNIHMERSKRNNRNVDTKEDTQKMAYNKQVFNTVVTNFLVFPLKCKQW